LQFIKYEMFNKNKIQLFEEANNTNINLQA